MREERRYARVQPDDGRAGRYDGSTGGRFAFATRRLNVARSRSRSAASRSSRVSIAAMFPGQRAGLGGGAGVGAVDDADDGGEGRVQPHPAVQAEGVGLLARKDQGGFHRRQHLAQRPAGFERRLVPAVPGEARAPSLDLAGRLPERRYPSVQFTGLAVVFHGWEMVRLEDVAGQEFGAGR